MRNLDNQDGKFKAHEYRAIVIHGRGGAFVFPYVPQLVSELTDPNRELGPWYPAPNRGALHLTHDAFTNWLGPRDACGCVPAAREKML